MSAFHLPALRSAVDSGFPSLLADLEALVRVPSVSAASFDPRHLDVSARAVVDLLEGVGFAESQILRAPKPDGSLGAPAVVAHRPGPAGAPTVLLYAHHDVQPPGEGWDTEPFEPTCVGERLYGRGAADDKAGIVAHIGALRALAEVGQEPQVGITVFIEGEEEDGSPSFTAFLAAHRDLLRADVIVVPDSTNWKVGVPGLTTSLRGLVDGTVTVSVLEHAVHSGMYGGPILDANVLLARLIATLHDEQGNVAVAGLVSGPAPAVDFDEAEFRAESSLLDGVRLVGSGGIATNLWVKPALSVIGVDATSVALASNTLAPNARAKLSLRIAPGQDPAAAAAALEAHLLANAPFGARVEFEVGSTGQPFAAQGDTEAMRIARSCFADAWGVDPVDIGVGGSIPFIADFLDFYPEAAILVTGVEDPDSRAHGANESVHLGELRNVIVAEALLLQRLG
ncbi:MAG: dipeptidase [Promicromonosporaceae bacterium]|nr:dipeptidase [Promicromonosporaceae bacterium]